MTGRRSAGRPGAGAGPEAGAGVKPVAGGAAGVGAGTGAGAGSSQDSATPRRVVVDISSKMPRRRKSTTNPSHMDKSIKSLAQTRWNNQYASNDVFTAQSSTSATRELVIVICDDNRDVRMESLTKVAKTVAEKDGKEEYIATGFQYRPSKDKLKNIKYAIDKLNERNSQNTTLKGNNTRINCDHVTVNGKTEKPLEDNDDEMSGFRVSGSVMIDGIQFQHLEPVPKKPKRRNTTTGIDLPADINGSRYCLRNNASDRRCSMCGTPGPSRQVPFYSKDHCSTCAQIIRRSTVLGRKRGCSTDTEEYEPPTTAKNNKAVASTPIIHDMPRPQPVRKVSQWTEEEVRKFVERECKHKEVAARCFGEEIDGAALLLLDEHHLIRYLSATLGQALKLMDVIRHLPNK